MKRVILTLLAIATLFCFNSCEDIISGALGGGNNSGESENKIATTAEQIDAIKASLPKLRSTLKSAKSFVSPVETKADSTETTEPTVPPSDSLDQANDNVEEYIRALEEKIELLEEYVYSEQQKEWLASTYATIELYEETVSVLANLQCEIEALKGTLEEAQETLRAEIANSITTCFSSMQSWVNELLTGYYDIATTDAMFAKMQEEFTEADEETRAEIEALRASLAEQFKEMEDSYKSAIKDAIEKSNGVLTEKIEKEIKSVNDRIDEVVATINERLAEIEERLSKLEDSVQALINRIQSIAYIPVYDDANARVNFPNNDTSEGTLTLDFNISPKNAVEDIAKAYQDIITVKVMYTGSSDQINLPVIGCSCNAELGTLTVICACDNLSMEFYHGEVNARAIMHISDGNNDKNSEYIPLTPNLTKIPNNQIWYTVNGKTAVDIKCENGPKIVTNIFDQAKNCYVATFDKDVTSVQASYFAGKTELTTVSLPHSILIIEDSAFEGCSSLTQATLGNSVVSIGSNAFADCNLSSMHFPETLSEMGVNCFDYNEIAYFVGGPTLEDGISLVLGKTLKGVALGGLKEGAYTIPEGINTIGGSVFSGCSSLKEISLHKDITIIEENAFEGCSSLAKVDITDINKWCKLDFANPYANPLCNGAALYQNGSEVVEVIFPNDMTIVKPYAFYGCSSLRSVTLHDKITEVGESAFHGCTNLSSIMMQSTVPPVLKDNVFEGCSNLQIYIPTDEKAVRAYLTCDWYEKYQHMVVWELKELPRTHKIEYTTSNGKILEYNAANIHSHVYSDGKGVITFTIPCTSFSGFKSDQNRLLTCELPESVVSIEDGAFSGCSNLKEFMIPGGITSLGKDLFNGCSSLKSIVIPGNVSEIKESAFRGCSSLTAINIPSNVTSIREFTFAECSALTSVRIHKNISSIEASAFKDCSSLTEVCFEAQTPPSVHETAFDGCDNAKIIIPEDENTVLAYLGGNWSNELLQMIPDYIYTGKLPESYWFEYTTTDSKIVEFKDQNIFYNVYENGKGIALSKAPITSFAGVQSGNERLLTCKLPKGLTQIEYEAFNGCSKLKEFTIPEEVTDILASTFKGCSSLTKFTIHKGIRNIGYYAFKDCSNLTEVRFEAQTPPSVNESAFEGCNNLRIYLPEDEATVKAYLGGSWSNSLLCLIPDNIYTDKLSPNYWIEYTTTDSKTVEFIDQDIFYNIYENSKGIALSKTPIKTFRGILSGNERLLTCKLPEDLTAIDGGAFEGCSSLKEFTIPKEIAIINSRTFKGCSSLTSIVLPKKVTGIKDYAFEGCTSITKFTIHNAVKNIDSYAFKDCKNLNEVHFEAQTPPEVSNWAFEGCDKVKIIIPEDEATVKAYLAGNWSNVLLRLVPDHIITDKLSNDYWLEYTTTDSKTVEFNDYNLFYNSYENGRGVALSRTPITSFGGIQSGNERLLTCKLAENLTSIGIYAFSGCSSLKEFKIPAGVTVISDYMFQNCSNLKSVNIHEQVTELAHGSFSGCTSLTEFTVTKGIKSIGYQAFNGCSNLVNVYFEPHTAPSAGYDSFVGCDKLKITIPDDAIACKSYLESDWTDELVLKIVNLDYIPEDNIVEYTSTDGKVIEFCNMLKNSYNDGVGTTFSRFAIKEFAGVSSGHERLSSCNLPESCTQIGSQAFINCTGLRTITIPGNIKSVGDATFWKCSKLEEITLPENCIQLGAQAFVDCSNLKKIEILGNITAIKDWTFSGCYKLERINIPESCQSIGSYALAGCSSLKEITIPANCEKIGESAFNSCSNITKIEILSNLKYLSKGIFNGCYKMKAFTIPDSCEEIEDDAFNSCTGLSRITIPKNCVKIGDAAFSSCSELSNIEILSDLKTISDKAFSFCGSLTEISLPESCTKIGKEAFRHSGLTGMVIPENCTEIDDEAFADMYSLKDFTLNSETPPTLGDDVFYNTTLENVYVPEGAVATYKAASLWEKLADIIKAIL